MYSSLGTNKLVCCHLCCLSVCRLTSSYRMNVLVHYPIHRFVHGPKPVDYLEWVVPEKIHTSPTEKICAARREGARKSLDLLQSFPLWGSMDIFYNDPMSKNKQQNNSLPFPRKSCISPTHSIDTKEYK